MLLNDDRIQFIIPKEPDSYEGYLYKIAVVDTGKKYIGYRSKPYDGTYYFSSECPIFAKDLSEANKIIFEILDYGYNVDMASKERKMLVEVNAKDNPEYYNKSNGGGIHAIAYTSIMDVYDSINNGDFDSFIKDVLITELMTYGRIQVRFKDDDKHRKNITDKVNDNYGDSDYIKNTFLVHALEDYDGPGEHRLINGTHTRNGISKSKYGKTAFVRTMFIPKEIWIKFPKEDILHLGLTLNPRSKNDRKPTDDDDLIKSFFEPRFKKGIPIDAAANKFILKSEPFYFTSSQVTGLIKTAKSICSKQSWNGKIWINWRDSHWLPKLNAIVEEHRDPTTFTMAMSSGNFNWNDIMAAIEQNCGLHKKKNERKDNFILYVHHPAPNNIDYKKQWFDKVLPSHSTEMDLIFGVLGVNYTIEYLLVFVSDGSKGNEEIIDE